MQAHGKEKLCGGWGWGGVDRKGEAAHTADG